MRQILSSALKLYWAVAFAAMSAVCVFDLENGMLKVFRLLALTDVGMTDANGSGLLATGLFGSAFALVSLLFLWAFVVGLLDTAGTREADEVARMAFGFGGGMLAAASVLAAVLFIPGVFSAIAIQLAAMLASYLAIRTEGRTTARAVSVDRPISSVQAMATNAARNYARVGARGNGATSEGR